MKGSRRRKAISIGILILILAGAALLRLHRLGDRPLYGDEPYHTVIPATQPLRDVLSTNYGSILYPVILHFTLHLGPLEFMARLPSAVFGILAVGVLYGIARRVFRRRREALMAAVFGATSGILLLFSQEARGYSGMLFFSLLALYFLLRAVEENRPVFWAGYAASVSVGVYMHLFLLIIVPVHALYIGILAVAGWRKTRRLSWNHPAVRLAAPFAAASAAALVAAYVFYLPTRISEYPGIDFFDSLLVAAEGLMRSGAEIAIFSYGRDIIFRLLDHQVWPLLFFFKVLLALAGLAACLKDGRREGILFALYLTLPFILFVYSNPPATFQGVQHNKFIFLAPIFHLLMAGGFGALDSLIAERRSKVRSGASVPALRNLFRVVLVAAILFGEGLCLLEFRKTIWDTRAFPRNTEVVDHIRDRILGRGLVLSDSYVSSLSFVFAKPIAMPRTGRPQVMFFKGGHFFYRWNHAVPIGLWMVLSETPFDEDDARRLQAVSETIEIHSFAPHTLISYPDKDRTLGKKVSHLMEFFKTLPISEAKRREAELFLAYTFLIAGKNAEALAVLDDMDGGIPSSWEPPGAKKETILNKMGYSRYDIRYDVFNHLIEEIDGFLLRNAVDAAETDNAEEALALLRRIRLLNDQAPAFRTAVHTARGDALRLKGRRECAEKEYLRALTSAGPPMEEAELIRRISRLRNMPAGILVMQEGRTCRIRWWSDERREFVGRIGFSEKIGRIRGFRLTEADSHLKDGRDIGFRGVSQKGRVKGLTIDTRRPARVEMLLRIEGLRSLDGHLIVIPDENNPDTLKIE